MTAPLAPGWHDATLAELEEAMPGKLRSAPLPWLTSLGYCTTYDAPPATRGLVEISDERCIKRAAFYRERRVLGLRGVIEFVGFPDISDQQIKRTLVERGTYVAVVNRLVPPGAATGRREHPSIALTHDVIAELPPTADEYLRSLGKQKRQQLPRYWRRLQRQYSDLTVHFDAAGEINLDDILQLVAFNQTRMTQQGKADTTVAESAKQRRRWPLTQDQGLLCRFVAGGKLLGGTFNYVHRDEAFLIVIAHDPTLEHLNIGNVALWKTFEHLIERGIKRYHLFWGRKRYKTDFGGVDHAVVISVIGRARWLAALWKAWLVTRRQVPRGFRFARSLLRRTLGARS